MMKYRAEIDGLRALAILPVVFFHAGFQLFEGGYVGVDIFFVISGYLITSLIIEEISSNKFSLAHFYERRARRLLPSLFFVILVCLPFAIFWMPLENLKEFGGSLIAVSTFSSNVFFWLQSGYFDSSVDLKPFIHTWSLAVEEQFYIFFPVFLFFTWQFGLKVIVSILFFIFLLSLGFAQWGSLNIPSSSFYLLPTRGWELLLGSFVAIYLNQHSHISSKFINESLSIVGLSLIFASIFSFDESIPFPSVYTLIPTLGCAMLIISKKNTYVHKALSINFLVIIGLISYSAYLWHQPLLAFTRIRFLENPPDLLIFLICILSFVIAYLTWQFIEKPFRYDKKFSRKNIFNLTASFSILIIIIGSFLYFSIKTEKDFWSKDVLQYECLLQDDPQTIHDPKCISNPSGFLLWGDSHAAALSIGLRGYFQENNIPFSQLTQSGCPPIFNLTRLNHRKTCNLVNDNILKLIKINNFQNIILHAAWMHPHYPLSNEELDSKLNETVSILKTYFPDINILIIGNIPRWSANPKIIQRMSEEKIIYEDVEFRPIKNIGRLNKIFEKVSDAHDVTFIDPFDFLCLDQIQGNDDKLFCAFGENSNNFYMDWGHLQRSGSEYVVRKIPKDFLFVD